MTVCKDKGSRFTEIRVRNEDIRIGVMVTRVGLQGKGGVAGSILGE